MDSDIARTREYEAPAGDVEPLSGPDAAADSGPPVMTVRALMTSAEVAELLHVSQATLCRWRRTGAGPRTLWLSGRAPRYRWKDVQQWMERSRS